MSLVSQNPFTNLYINTLYGTSSLASLNESSSGNTTNSDTTEFDPKTVEAFKTQLLQTQIVSVLLEQQLSSRPDYSLLGSNSSDPSYLATLVSNEMMLDQTKTIKPLIDEWKKNLEKLDNIIKQLQGGTSNTPPVQDLSSGNVSNGSDIAKQYADLNISLGLKPDLS